MHIRLLCYLVLICLLSLFSPLKLNAGELISQEKFIGVLEIPSLFGVENDNHQAVTKINSSPLKIYSSPKKDAQILTTIKNYELLANIEYDYEKYGALVFEEHNGWYLVGLAKSKTKGWIPSLVSGKYYSLYEAVNNASSIDSWQDKRLYLYPNFDSQSRVANIRGEAPYVEVLEKKIAQGDLWVKVKLKDNACGVDGDQESQTTDQGWMPVFSKSGQLNVWVAARGC